MKTTKPTSSAKRNSAECHSAECNSADPSFLEKHFQEFKKGLITQKRLEEIIFQRILDKHRLYGVYYKDRSDCVDFLVSLYPNIVSCIKRYQNRGSTFDAYVATMVRTSFKNHQARLTEESITENMTWEAASRERSAESMAGWASEDEDYEYFGKKRIRNPRQALLLLLKSYYYVTDDMVTQIAPALNIEPERITEFIEQLRKIRRKREDEMHKLKELSHAQFYKCVTCERRLESALDGSAKEAKLQAALESGRRHLDGIRARLAHTKVTASNREVAEVLGIPKGTVDANLSACKRAALKKKGS